MKGLRARPIVSGNVMSVLVSKPQVVSGSCLGYQSGT